MNYCGIIKADVANGLGFRVSIFVSGCRNKCPGCFNSQASDFKFGKEFTQKESDLIIEALNKHYIKGITFLGGDPLEPENQEDVYNLIKRIRDTYGEKKDIWLYTGGIYEEIIKKDSRWQTPYLDKIFNNIDVLVDGPFILAKKDIQNTPFRGSTNQRLIDMKKTMSEKQVKELIL